MNNSTDPSLEPATAGLHHVTAICGDPQENLDFYSGTLGMRLVKKSVNQDDPSTYHLFYADAVGSPGTDLTFFPWPQMAAAKRGGGKALEVSLSVPAGSLDYWLARIERSKATIHGIEERFGDRVLALEDPHAMPLALVESRVELGTSESSSGFTPWVPRWPPGKPPQDAPVPATLQIRALHSARLDVREIGPSAEFLTEVLGFHRAAQENGWVRFAIGGHGTEQSASTQPWRPGTVLDLRQAAAASHGHFGVGSIHHLAWRVRDGAHELELRHLVEQAGRRPTEVIDRFWFQSVYFHEPGGVLFELATDGPGFAVDEDPEHLGEALILPPWLEPRRQEIEAALPPLAAPGTG